MKKCPFCSAEIEENARFCLYCMSPLEEKQVIETENKQNKQWLIYLAAVLVLALVFGSFWFALGKNKPIDTSSEIFADDESSYSPSLDENIVSSDKASQNSTVHNNSNPSSSSDTLTDQNIPAASTESENSQSSNVGSQPSSDNKNTYQESSQTNTDKITSSTDSKNSQTSNVGSKPSDDNKDTSQGNSQTSTGSSNPSDDNKVTSQASSQTNNDKTNTTESSQTSTGSSNPTISANSTNQNNQQSNTPDGNSGFKNPSSSVGNSQTNVGENGSNQNNQQNNNGNTSDTTHDTSNPTSSQTPTPPTEESSDTEPIESSSSSNTNPPPTGISYIYRAAQYGDDFSVSANLEDCVVITGVNTPSVNGEYIIPETIDGKKVIAIMGLAFCDDSINDTVKKVIVPSTVKNIWNYAFANCYNLSDIYFCGNSIYTETDAFPEISKRSGTLTINCSATCSDRNFRYYKNNASNYDAEYEEWNG